MMSKKLLEKFKKLYYEKFGIALSNEEATAMANDLVNLMKVLLEPDKPKSTESKLEERSEYATIETQQQYI